MKGRGSFFCLRSARKILRFGCRGILKSRAVQLIKRFCKTNRQNPKIVEINFSDNPWFPSVLNDERLYDLERNPEIYKHIWEGDYNRNSDALVFNGYFIVKEFDQHVDFDVWSGPHFGLDFGFSTDPMACVRCYIDSERNLYISHESYHHNLEIDLY